MAMLVREPAYSDPRARLRLYRLVFLYGVQLFIENEQAPSSPQWSTVKYYSLDASRKAGATRC